MCIYAESAPRSAAKFPIPLVVDIIRLSIRISFSFEAVRKIACGTLPSIFAVIPS